MWLFLAFCSAVLLGCYDSLKKSALKGNAVLPVLFLNTLFCWLLFLPFIVLSTHTHVLDHTPFLVGDGGWYEHCHIMVKSVIVLASWLCGYYGMKYLPLTIVGPINATRPVMVLVGAMLVFGERLNVWQWVGVLFAVLSFFLLSRSGKREGIDFKSNRWVVLIVLAAVLGAVSGLYDKYLMAPVQEGGLGLDRMMVQSWYNMYQMLLMGIMLFVIWWPHRRSDVFHWHWSIIFISLFLSVADFLYFYSLSLTGSMVSIVSMVRRSSVVVSFLFGAFFFHEHNLRSKFIDLALVLLGLVFLWIGS